MKKKLDLFDLVLNIILIIIAILVIYWFIQLLIGGSPDLSQFNSALIVMIIGLLIKIYRESGILRTDIKHTFIYVKKDMNLMKNDINIIKKDIGSIKKNLKI